MVGIWRGAACRAGLACLLGDVMNWEETTMNHWNYRIVSTEYRNDWGEMVHDFFIAEVHYEVNTEGEVVPYGYSVANLYADDRVNPDLAVVRADYEDILEKLRAAVNKPILKYNPETHKLVPFEP